MSWYNSSWTKRKAITLTGGTSGAQTDYQVKLAVTHDADMKSDFSDLRFTKLDGTTLLDAWMESHTASTSAVVWVETNTPANAVEADIYCYYGNSGASSDWDIQATMVDGDDFSAALDTVNDWTVLDVTTGVSSGELTLSSFTGATHRYCASLMSKHQLSGSPLMFEARVKTSYTGDSMWIGAVNDDNIQAGDNQLLGMYSSGAYYRYSRNNGTATEDTTGAYSADTYYELGIKWVNGTSAEFYVDGGEIGADHTTNIANENMYLAFVGDSTVSPTIVADWIRARKYCANPATYAFGSEEVDFIPRVTIF